MAITAKTQNRLDELTAALKSAKDLSLNERDDYIEILAEAAEGTNGLTVEEKTQANSVNIFNLCYLFLRDKLEGREKVSGLYDLIYRCRTNITIIVGIVAALLVLRPQLAALIDAIPR